MYIMKLLGYLSILFVLVLFAGCTIDLRSGVPTVEFDEDLTTPQIQDPIVEDVTPGKEAEIPEEKPEEKPIEIPIQEDTQSPEDVDVEINYVSMSEIQQHNTFNDCWIILEGKVYDANVLISTHPSGRMVINYCGKDATEFIKTQLFKGEVDFLKNAEGYLKQSYIGELQ
jgi:cytochrome b involved in lipid metabolism